MTDTSIPTDAAGAVAEPAGSRSSFSYRPALDGLRALAILLVVPFNLDWGLHGGFIGVDVFFVLSGFLITSLLLAERSSTGRIRLPRFYLRRALRLLPALVLLLAAMLAYTILFADPKAFHDTAADATAVLLYVGNWVVAFGKGGGRGLGALAHCWSLSVEEQFYLLWPPLLVLLLRVDRSGRWATAVAAAGALLAMAWRADLSLSGTFWIRLYTGTDTRADALLIGCVLGLALHARTPGPATRRTLAALAPLALAALLGAAWVLRPQEAILYRVGFPAVALATAVLLAHLYVEPDGWLARGFGHSVPAWIGRVSYGIYLWHYPIAVFVSPARLDGVPRPAVELLRLILCALVVTASYRWVEQPFLRLKDRIAASGRARRRAEESAVA